MPLVASPSQIENTLMESFVEDQLDGYWYPHEPGEPLVRVQVGGGAYSIERRRTPDSSWMPVVTAATADFDPQTFRTWRASWPVVA